MNVSGNICEMTFQFYPCAPLILFYTRFIGVEITAVQAKLLDFSFLVNVSVVAKYNFCSINRALYGAAMLVFLRGTPK